MADNGEVTAGRETSEHAVAAGNSRWAIVAAVLGFITSFGSMIAQVCGSDTKIGIIVGGVLAAAGLLSKTLTDLGYIKSRADVKAAASWSRTSAGSVKGDAL